MADWQKGDLALCVNDTVNPFYGVCTVRKGRIYTVEGVGRVLPNRALGISLSLYLEGERGVSGNGFSSSRFRKVTPPKADEFDREVIDLMAGKRVPA